MVGNMTKKEFKFFLQIFSKIKEKQIEQVGRISIEIYGRKKNINIPPCFFQIESYLAAIMESEKDVVVTGIIQERYFRGKKDKTLLAELPVTESGYYRLKRRIEEKVYELLIEAGAVTKEEILNNKIIRKIYMSVKISD